MKTTIKTTKARSIRELARRVGRSLTAVRRWVKDDRWPFPRRGPWDVEAVRRWAKRTLMPEPGTPGHEEFVAAQTADRTARRNAAERKAMEQLMGADALAEFDRAYEETMREFEGGR